MTDTISRTEIGEILRGRLGSSLVDRTELCAHLQTVLTENIHSHTALSSMAEQVENTLFNELYTLLGPAMTVYPDGHNARRILLSELKEIADDLLFPVLDNLTVYSVNCELIREYYMQTGSLAAARVLHTKYAALLGLREATLLERMIRTNYPPARWQAWIDRKERISDI